MCEEMPCTREPRRELNFLKMGKKTGNIKTGYESRIGFMDFKFWSKRAVRGFSYPSLDDIFFFFFFLVGEDLGGFESGGNGYIDSVLRGLK